GQAQALARIPPPAGHPIESPEFGGKRKAMQNRLSALGLAALIALAPAAGAGAETRAFRADYTVTLLGLPVAKASFDSTFTAGRFHIEGSVSSSGLARIFDDTRGTTSAQGAIRSGKVVP